MALDPKALAQIEADMADIDSTAKRTKAPSEHEHVTSCPPCNGTGLVDVNGVRILCPGCDGSGSALGSPKLAED